MTLVSCNSSTQIRFPEHILVLIVDGATWDVIDPLMNDNKLPTIKSLVKKGVSGPLKTINPTVSPTIWTSIATSRKYEDHGILGFKMAIAIGMWLDFENPEEKPHLVTSNMRKTEALWTILSQRDMSVGVINYLVTWPAEQVNGFMITDRAIKYPGEIENSVYPGSIEHDVLNYIKTHKKSGHDFHNRFANDELAVDSCVTELALHMSSDNPPQLMIVGLRGIDAMQHQFWQYYKPDDPNWHNPECQPKPLVSTDNVIKGDTAKPYERPSENDIRQLGHLIPEYYTHVDRLLNRLITGLGDNWTFIILSDHGFTPPLHLNAPPGIIICSGNPFIHRRNFTGYSIYDIAPTVLYLLNLPVAKDMTGIPMLKAMNPELVKTNPVASIPSYETGRDKNKTDQPVSSNVDDKILERLKTLGYIEE